MTYRGSRKHVLDWTGRDTFLSELQELLEPVPVTFSDRTRFMPRGYEAPEEALLNTFGPTWFLESPAWDELQNWWLKHPVGANTPNWDIAVGCEIEEQPAVILVEAKANWPELNTLGKSLAAYASWRSRENHEQIKRAIEEACAGWRKIDDRVSISRDSHYQLANRLAFTWKLATLGIPTVLLYLGFTGDEGIRDAGEPFADDADWQQPFRQYIDGTIPFDLFSRRLEIGSSSVWLLSRSLEILDPSPPKNTE